MYLQSLASTHNDPHAVYNFTKKQHQTKVPKVGDPARKNNNKPASK